MFFFSPWKIPKINMEPKIGGFGDFFPFHQLGDLKLL